MTVLVGILTFKEIMEVSQNSMSRLNSKNLVQFKKSQYFKNLNLLLNYIQNLCSTEQTDQVETLILSKQQQIFIFFFNRTTSGGLFNLSQANFDYRENFKKSLRSYERCVTRNSRSRPIFSA